MGISVEICLDGIVSAECAQQGGASRVELCDNLMEGGTTPSQGMISLVRERLDIDVMVMIRPRGGDFLYTESEFEVMVRDVRFLQQQPVTGIVFGMLLPDGRVDVERTRRLIDLARPMQVTFHRAFDMSRDPFEALDSLSELGVERILTSGQQPTAAQGLPLITALQKQAGDGLIIMPAVAISAENAAEIVRTSGVRELHIGSNASHQLTSGMQFQNAHSSMGDDLSLSEYALTYTSAAKVRTIVDAVQAL